MRKGLVELARGDGFVVVAKPPRLLVHRNAQHPHAAAALQIVRGQVGRRVYPIHRLDSAASGCLLFATDRDLAGALSVSLQQAQKTYVALCRGTWRAGVPESLVVQTPMKDDLGVPKEAETAVRLLGTAEDPRCSLLEASPRTGRFHQVRRHVRDLHHPILCDLDHGDSRENRLWRTEHGLVRLALHCLHLSLRLPDGQPLEVTCPLFSDLQAVFGALPFWEAACARQPLLAHPALPWAG